MLEETEAPFRKKLRVSYTLDLTDAELALFEAVLEEIVELAEATLQEEGASKIRITQEWAVSLFVSELVASFLKKQRAVLDRQKEPRDG